MARPINEPPARRPPDRRVIAAIAAVTGFAVVLLGIWSLLQPGSGGVAQTSARPSVILPRQTVVLTTPGPTRGPGSSPDGSQTPPLGGTPSSSGGPTPAGPTTSSNPSEPPASPTTPATPLPPGAGLAVNWVKAESPGLGVVPSVSGAASGYGRVVVIGEATDDFLPGIWSSTDGKVWQAANFPDAQNEGVQMTAVAANASQFVAFAYEYETGNAVAYASTDGQNWTRSDDSDFVEDGVYALDTVGSTFVAASDEGVLLTSTDGLNWTPLSDPTATVIATGILDFASYNGTLYALVIDFSAPEDQQPIGVWSTRDGAAWSRLGNIAGTEGVVEAYGAAGPKGLVVMSEVDQGDFFGWRAWQSPDGATWQPATNTPTDITDVVADQTGFVAVGFFNLAGDCTIDETENVGTTWTSVDGLKWRELSHDGWVARQIQALGFVGRTLVGAGIDWELYNQEPTGDSGLAWTADLPDSATDDAPAPAPTPKQTPLPDCGD